MLRTLMLAWKFMKFGSKGLIRRVLMSSLIRKSMKWGTLALALLIMLLTVGGIWLLMTTGYLITEGEFDDSLTLMPDEDSPREQAAVTYDEITDIINTIELNRIPDDLMIVLPESYLRPQIPAKTLLKSYMLFAEICSDPLINPDDALVKVEPWMLYGIWQHEGGVTLEGGLDPYSAWLDRLAYTYITVMGQRTIAASYGSTVIQFAEKAEKTSYMGGVYSLTGPMEPLKDVKFGFGKPVLFRSSNEVPELEGTRALVGVSNASSMNGVECIGAKVENSLVYKNHSRYAWSSNSAQRPSAMFFPDATATTAYSATLWFDGREMSTGNPSEAAALAVELANRYPDAKQYYALVSMFGRRAGKLGLWFNDENGLGFQIISELREGKNGYTLDYLGSAAMVEEFSEGNANKMFASTQTFFNKVLGTKAGSTYTNLAGAQKSMLSKELRSKIDAKLTKSGSLGAEDLSALFDGLYIITAGKLMKVTVKDLATRMAVEYPREFEDTGDAGRQYVTGLGKNSFDVKNNSTGAKFPDGRCDKCGESVFNENVECGHDVSSKIFYPVVPRSGTALSSPADYHAAGTCPNGIAIHKKYGHFAYDFGSSMVSNRKLIASIPGMVSEYENDALGRVIMLNYPNKNNAELKLLYCHTARGVAVKTGFVNAGQTIGEMGSSGYGAGEGTANAQTHLHLEAKVPKSNQPIDLFSVTSQFYFGWKSSGSVTISPYVEMTH